MREALGCNLCSGLYAQVDDVIHLGSSESGFSDPEVGSDGRSDRDHFDATQISPLFEPGPAAMNAASISLRVGR